MVRSLDLAMGNTYLTPSVTHTLGREGLIIVQVSVAVIKHHHQSNWWRRVNLVYYGQSPLREAREAESGTQTRQESGGWIWYRGHGEVLLTDLLTLAFLACDLILHCTTRPGWYPPQWAGSCHINHQIRTRTTALLTGRSSTEAPFYKKTLVCVGLT